MSSYNEPSQHLFWLASRSLGVTAVVLLSLSVALGLSLSGRLARRPGGPGRIKAVHEALSLSALLAIVGHGLLLLGDSYLHPGLAGIALPFALSTKRAFTGIGVIGGWLALIIGLSFYVRHLISVAVWRWLHRWTLAVYLLALIHTFGSGTDAGSPWLRIVVAASAVPVVFAAVYRLSLIHI